MSRLSYFIALFIAATFSCTSPEAPGSDQPALPDDGTSKYYQAEQKPFYHGVASGDPLADRVIIWTRVTPETTAEVAVKWEIATDQTMQNKVQSGNATTGPDRDFTVKVDVEGLQPATHYYFQFEALGAKSTVGRTKTAPAENGPDSLQFAVVSCSNFEAGYFNAFARIAALPDIDAVLHLGDYIYEYEPGRYGDTTLGRFHLPPAEIVALSDYRTRYSQYRLDPDFQLVHQLHPFITIWDDHEIANNSHQTGAENHQPDEEGDYQVRKAAARQAYYEWLPVRDSDQKLYRTISYGAMADLIMLDERLAGRSLQADSITQADYAAPDRSMLGKEQLDWFETQLKNSTARWKIIGNQVIFSDLDMSASRPNSPRNLDAWDGYPAEKQYIKEVIANNDIQNVVFVTGDTHMSWAYEVCTSIEAYKADPGASVAVEFGTTSITSSNLDERVDAETVRAAEQSLQQANPHLKFTNMSDHGYLLLKLREGAATAEWRYVETISEKNDAERTGKIITLQSGETRLQ